MGGGTRAAGAAAGAVAALCVALAGAAAAGTAYCVKRRRRDGQFGYLQVRWLRGGRGGGAEPRAGPGVAGREAGPALSTTPPLQADLREDEDAEEEERSRGKAEPRADRARPQRRLVAIPNPLYGGHASDYEPLHVSAAPAPPRPSSPHRPALTPLSPQDALLQDPAGPGDLQ